MTIDWLFYFWVLVGNIIGQVLFRWWIEREKTPRRPTLLTRLARGEFYITEDGKDIAWRYPYRTAPRKCSECGCLRHTNGGTP